MRERTRGRCYRCGERGHHRQQCDQPRRPRGRSTFQEVDQLQDQEHSDWCDVEAVVNDVSGHHIIGGPADGNTRTGAPLPERARVGTTEQESRNPSAGRNRHRPSTQNVYSVHRDHTPFPETFEVMTCSPLRRMPADNRARSGSTCTTGARIGAAVRRTTTQMLNRRETTNRRTVNGVLQPVSTPPTPMINRPHSSIGGPADGSIEFCSRGSLPRR